MGKRINIGVYIGTDDTDIAAWFNLLQEYKMSRAKWVRGLFAAYAMDRPLSIGTIHVHAPLMAEPPKQTNSPFLFGKGDSQNKPVKSDHYGYGWQIRGPNREFINGSVINVSIQKAEILPVVEEAWRNGHQLASFLKALIRKNLRYGDETIPPDIQNLQEVYSAYLVSQNSQPVQEITVSRPRRKKISKPLPESDHTESLSPQRSVPSHSSSPKKIQNPLFSQF